MSIIDKWNQWYKDLPKEPSTTLYGDTLSYKMGADFLKDCEIVEDWGVGTGAFKLHRPDAIGVDGSDTPHADVKADLTTYTSDCDGIFLRHVLEHNKDWQKILINAIKSARKVCVINFMPLSTKGTVELEDVSFQNRKYGVDVPTFSLGIDQFKKIFKSVNVDVVEESYATETIFLITKGDTQGNTQDNTQGNTKNMSQVKQKLEGFCK